MGIGWNWGIISYMGLYLTCKWYFDVFRAIPVYWLMDGTHELSTIRDLIGFKLSQYSTSWAFHGMPFAHQLLAILWDILEDFMECRMGPPKYGRCFINHEITPIQILVREISSIFLATKIRPQKLYLP